MVASEVAADRLRLSKGWYERRDEVLVEHAFNECRCCQFETQMDRFAASQSKRGCQLLRSVGGKEQESRALVWPPLHQRRPFRPIQLPLSLINLRKSPSSTTYPSKQLERPLPGEQCAPQPGC